MEPISQTQQQQGPEAETPPGADIFVSHAGDAGEWAEKFTRMLLRPGSQVDSREESSTGRKRAGLSGKYAAFVALVTPEYVKINEAGIDTTPLIGRPAEGARRYAVLLERAPLDELPWMAPFTVLPEDRGAVLDAKDPEGLLAGIASRIRAEADTHLASTTSSGGSSPEVQQQTTDTGGHASPSGPPSPSGAASLSGAADPLRELLSRYRIFGSVAGVLEHAASYAAAASPPYPLSTSLVLLTFAERGSPSGAPVWAGDWIRIRLGAAFDSLRRGYFEENHIPSTVQPGKRVAGLRPGIALTLDRARDLARRTTGTDEIRARHLLAALLTDPRSEAGATQQLRRAGLDHATLLVDLYDFVRGYGDDDEAWGQILLGHVPDGSKLSGFDADNSRSVDYLDVRPDVEAFGKLIAARTVNPPLSIGLFGEWGSGKTFFMRMLRDEVDRLARLADESGRMQRDLPYWKRIIQIEFNAWHYVEGNLWASLVQHIFDNLRFAGESDRGVIRELQRHLVSQVHTEKAAETQALRERTEAEALVQAAGGEVDLARRAFEAQAGELARLSASNFLSDIRLESVREAAAGTLNTLGLTEVGSSAVDLRTALEEARALLSRGRSVAAPLLYAPDRRRRLVYLILALCAGPAVAVGLGWLLTGLGEEGIAEIGAISGGVAGALSTAAVWIRAQLARANGWIREVENAQRSLDQRVARAQAKSLEVVRAAEEKLRLYEADYQAAKRKEGDAQRRVADAEMRLKEASVTELLTDFVETRANSTDYRKHLGTLALVRNDFEKLSEIIDAENWRLSPGENEEGRPFRKFETAKQELRDRARRINRIVLYIDDLDRCPPAKVVEVLQAVHLLLAFPLFVVVVGVDARWVVRSVETRYRELLRAGQGADDRGQESSEFLALFGTATAHDYLEKIFQVPFWLRAMTDRACQKMVGGLLTPSLAPEAEDTTHTGPLPQALRHLTASASPQEAEPGAGKGAEPASGSAAPASAGAAEASPAGGAETRDDSAPPQDSASGRVADEKEAKKEASEGDASEAALSPEALQIQRIELVAIEAFAPLLGRSPRALKRFVNVYRLIKTSLTPYERKVFLGSDALPDYLAVLFLLAVDTGAPSAAPAIFRAIRDLSAASFFQVPEELRLAQTDVASNGASRGVRTLGDLVARLDAEPELKGEADWARVRHWLVTGDDTYRLSNDLGRLARWVPRVSRYSFHTGRMERPHAPAAEPDAEKAVASA